MITAGIDVGAKSVKVLIAKDHDIMNKGMGLMEMDRERSIREIFDKCLADAGLSKNDIDYIVSTGAGRKFVPFAQGNSTMVTCDAIGIVKLEPSVRTLIDIGANDARAVRFDETGRVIDFAVNEKCAAGAGAFVEAMARAMEVSLEEFSELSLKAEKTIPINAQCAIFAESEVVSLVHEETARNDICRSVHDAMAGRIVSMTKRLLLEKDIAVVGGVALNKGMMDSLKRDLKMDFIIPKDAEYVGALGAAILAGQEMNE